LADIIIHMQRNKLLILIVMLFYYTEAKSQSSPQHYIFFNLDRERIHDSTFLNTREIKGAQLKYTWKELEPQKDKYNLNLIQKDLDFLAKNNKGLFIQIQDVSFDTTIILVPRYLISDPVYNGGANYQYNFLNDEETVCKKEGWVARRWDKEVAIRFHKLLNELGKRFDGKITGINLPETAVGFGNNSKLHPPGFTFEKYRDAIKENMHVAKESFPNSMVIQYANFMPGEWLPWNDHSYLKDLYNYAKEIKVGMGGPDILVFKKGQMNHSYGFIRNCDGVIPTGAAVQDGNYEYINPMTGKVVTIEEIYEFGKDYLKLEYIFWCTQEPFYSKKLIPFLMRLNI
jgi:hypothetical protein